MLAHAVFVLSLSFAHAVVTSPDRGVISGGGGGGFVCRNANDDVISSELLDFWEAREISDLTLIHDDVMSVDDQFNRANARLAVIDSDLAAKTKKNYTFIKSHKVEREKWEVEIDPPTDANNHIHDAKCPPEGIMFFDDDRKRLVIKKDAFAKFDSKTEVAAAYFHESLYKTMRDNKLEGGKDSVLTRIIVGCLFAEGDLGECLNLNPISLPKDRKVWACEIPASRGEPGLSFAAYKNDEEDWSIIPFRFGQTTFGFELTGGTLAKIPVTLPGMGGGEPGTGAFKLEAEAMRITGMERLGLPWPLKSPPFGSTDFSIVTTNPLTIQHGDSDQTYRCQ